MANLSWTNKTLRINLSPKTTSWPRTAQNKTKVMKISPWATNKHSDKQTQKYHLRSPRTRPSNPHTPLKWVAKWSTRWWFALWRACSRRRPFGTESVSRSSTMTKTLFSFRLIPSSHKRHLTIESQQTPPSCLTPRTYSSHPQIIWEIHPPKRTDISRSYLIVRTRSRSPSRASRMLARCCRRSPFTGLRNTTTK